jgi:hypothetical protein
MLKQKINRFLKKIQKNSSWPISHYGFEKYIRKLAFYPHFFGIKVHFQHSSAWISENVIEDELIRFGDLPFVCFQKIVADKWKNLTGENTFIIPHPVNAVYPKIKIKNKNKKYIAYFSHSYLSTHKLSDQQKKIIILNHKNIANILLNQFGANLVDISLSSHDYQEDVLNVYNESGLKVLPLINSNDDHYLDKLLNRIASYECVLMDNANLSTSYYAYLLDINVKIIKINNVNNMPLDKAFENNDNKTINSLFGRYYDLNKFTYKLRLQLALFLYYYLLRDILNNLLNKHK